MYQAIQISKIMLSKNQSTISSQFSIKHTITFCSTWSFFWEKMDQKVKGDEVKDQITTTFSEASNSGVTYSEILVVANVKLALFQL